MYIPFNSGICSINQNLYFTFTLGLKPKLEFRFELLQKAKDQIITAKVTPYLIRKTLRVILMLEKRLTTIAVVCC